MRRFLPLLLVLEGTALAAALAAVLLEPEALQRPVPLPPVFSPPVRDAEGGELARYELVDMATNRVRGFVEYQVEQAIEYEGPAKAVGRELHLRVTESDPRGQGSRSRTMIFRPRQHGFLPPLFDEGELPPGEAPVVATLEPAPVSFRGREREGFLAEAVRPRWSVTEIRDRFWFWEGAPLFGVVRRESEGVRWNLVVADGGRP